MLKKEIQSCKDIKELKKYEEQLRVEIERTALMDSILNYLDFRTKKDLLLHIIDEYDLD